MGKIYNYIVNLFCKVVLFAKQIKFPLKARRLLILLFSAIIVSVTLMPCFAYFTDSISSNSSLSALSIKNGNVSFSASFSSAEMKWYSKYGVALASAKKNPDSGDYIMYGPVYIEPDGDYDLESKINLLMQYTVEKTSGIVNDNLKANVYVTVTRCNSSYSEITGDEAFTETSDEVSATKRVTTAEVPFKLQFKPGWTYKINYKITLKSASDLGDNRNKYDINFTVNSIKVRSTQENNPKWGSLGIEDDYAKSISEED